MEKNTGEGEENYRLHGILPYEGEREIVEQDLPARAVTAKNHDYSYEKMLEHIEKVEKRKIANKMRVFKRG